MDPVGVWAVGRRSYVEVLECQVVGVGNFYVDSFAIHQLYSFENSIAHVQKPNGLHHAKKNQQVKEWLMLVLKKLRTYVLN